MFKTSTRNGLLTPNLAPFKATVGPQGPGILAPPGLGPLRGGLVLSSSRISGSWQGQRLAMEEASQLEADPGHMLFASDCWGPLRPVHLEVRVDGLALRPVPPPPRPAPPASLYHLVKGFLLSIWNLEFHYSVCEAFG